MIHPKKSAEESLNKILLMMKYDSSKTLSENLLEQPGFQSTSTNPLPTFQAGSTSATNNVGSSNATGNNPNNATQNRAKTTNRNRSTNTNKNRTANTTRSRPTNTTKTNPVTNNVGNTGNFRGKRGVIGAAVVGVAALGAWLYNKDNKKDAVEKLFNSCKDPKYNISSVPRKLSDNQIREMVSKIEEALSSLGTDEQALAEVFNTIGQSGSMSDLCALISEYEEYTGTSLIEDLDSDIDSDSDWNLIYRPIYGLVKRTVDTAPNPNPNPNPKPTPGGGKNCPSYKEVTAGPYTLCTASPVIKKVQGCLNNLGANLVPDSKFGVKTQVAFKTFLPAYVRGFNDSDVDTICGGSPTPTDDNTGGEADILDLSTDTDWGSPVDSTTTSGAQTNSTTQTGGQSWNNQTTNY